MNTQTEQVCCGNDKELLLLPYIWSLNYECEHDFQEATKTGNQLADVECELAFAKAQLSIYKNKNLELEAEVLKIRNTKTPTEEQLEKILEEKDNCISEKNTLILELQEKLSVADLSISEEIANLQSCISDGDTFLFDKDLQITLLQEKLEEICHEAEQQFNSLTQRDVNLGQLLNSLDQVNEEKQSLLSKIEFLETQQIKENVVKEETSSTVVIETKTIATNTEEARNNSRESSVEKRTKTALQEEILELKNQLKLSKDDLKSWKQKYQVINANLVAKEKKIDSLKCQLEESKVNSRIHQTASRKLREVEGQVVELRQQLEESERQLVGLRNNCVKKEETIATLRQELHEEIQRAQADRLRDEDKISEAEEQACKLQEEMLELKSNYDTKEQQLQALYKEKEIEMQRLISISCENVQGLQEVNSELMKKLEISEAKAQKLSEELETEQKCKCEKLEELAKARKELETFTSNSDSLQDQLTSAEIEIAETRDQLSKFETELVLSTEKILQLQSFLSQAHTDKQALTSQLVEIRSQMSAQTLVQQQQLAEMSAQLQSAAVEKEHYERSQHRLEEMCKSLTAQVRVINKFQFLPKKIHAKTRFLFIIII